MLWLEVFFSVLVLIAARSALTDPQIPSLDYVLGGPMAQPQIGIIEPDLNAL